MTDLTWLQTVLVVVLLLCVLVGTLPVVNTGLQFLALPLHAFRNHYGKAAPYTRTWPSSSPPGTKAR